MGTIGIRVLAGEALSGSLDRHPNAAQSVAPIATSDDYAGDVQQSGRFSFLVDESYASSLVEAAIRFAISKPELSTALVGISNMGQLEEAAASAAKGPLPLDALARVRTVWFDAEYWGTTTQASSAVSRLPATGDSRGLDQRIE